MTDIEINTDTDSAPEARTISSGSKAKIRRAVVALVLLFVIWLVFGQIIPRVFYHKTPADPVTQLEQKTAELEQMQERMAALENRISNVDMPATDSAIGDKIDALKESIDRQKQDAENVRIGEMENKLSAQSEELALLRKKLSDVQIETQTQLALLTALNQIKSAALSGQPFTASLMALKEQTMERPATQSIIDQLLPLASQPMPSEDELKESFDALIPAILAPDEGTFEGKLASLVRIRKVGEQKGTDDESIVARAEVALKRGDIAGTLSELSSLSKAALPRAQDWMNKAQSMLAVRTLVGTLELELSSRHETAPTEPTAEAPAAVPAPAPIEPPAPEESSPAAGPTSANPFEMPVPAEETPVPSQETPAL